MIYSLIYLAIGVLFAYNWKDEIEYSGLFLAVIFWPIPIVLTALLIIRDWFHR